MTRFKFSLIATGAFLVLGSPQAQAQQAAQAALSQADKASASDAGSDAVDDMATIVVTGTRSEERTLFDSLSPVDVISEKALQSNVSSDLNDQLDALVPSFNVERLPMADGQVFVRPATLRGLSPDQTLVLINGKRMHRSALLGTRGAQAPDLSQVPSGAISRVDVLRDGAAAQYGSDAIAGVINITLDDSTGFKGFSQARQYYQGDGFQWQTSLHDGWSIGDNGHFSGTLQYTDGNRTSRSVQRADAIAYEEETGIKVNDPVQHWGQPDLQSLRGEFNSEYALGAASLYAFGTYGHDEGWSDFNWRNPDSSTAYGSSTVDPDYDLYSIYPAGFTPEFGEKSNDFTVVAGVKGNITDELSWDSSVSHGGNWIKYYLDNSINASMGSASPTDFYDGELAQIETNVNLDFVYTLQSSMLAAPANLAFGLETREETYKIEAGDEASWEVGDLAEEGFPSGSNGFPGFSDAQAGSWDQRSQAGYVDVELPFTDRFTAGVAARAEHYSAFKDPVDGKISMRYEVSNALALRGTVSNGFRAPTPGQLYSTDTTQGLDTSTLALYTSGRISPTNAVAEYFGAKPLKPEKSLSYSLGMSFRDIAGLSGSLDVYQVKVNDRFGESQSYDVTDDIRDQLEAMGISGADSLDTITFFTNAFDTRTRGVDLTTNYDMNLAMGKLRLAAALNYNQTRVTRQDGTVSDYNVIRLERGLPKWKGNVSATWTVNQWELMGRARYFGTWMDATDETSGDIYQNFSPEVLFDVAATWHVNPDVSLRLGAENVFDNYPDKSQYQTSRGLIYSRNAPYDTDGGQYYLRVDYRF